MKKISIIGAGSWGIALARILNKNGHLCKLYDNDLENVYSINTQHVSSKIPEVTFEESITATSNLEDVVKFSDILVLSVPTKVIRTVLKELNQFDLREKLICNTSKGLEPGTFMRVSEIVAEEVDSYLGFVALSGPSHAEEVIKFLPTTICAVSDQLELALKIQNLFNNNACFRVYTGQDLIGTEISGAIKNVYAIASGMVEGLRFGDNARAGLITRALVEMKRILISFNANPQTLYGLTGVGDLIVTTTSHHSRNFQAGYKLATGLNLKQTIDSMTMTVEGAKTALAIFEYSKAHNLSTPIVDEVYHVIYEEKSVLDAIESLMMRALKEE